MFRIALDSLRNQRLPSIRIPDPSRTPEEGNHGPSRDERDSSAGDGAHPDMASAAAERVAGSVLGAADEQPGQQSAGRSDPVHGVAGEPGPGRAALPGPCLRLRRGVLRTGELTLFEEPA